MAPLAEGKRSHSAAAERDIGGEAAMCPPDGAPIFSLPVKDLDPTCDVRSRPFDFQRDLAETADNNVIVPP